jgi:hypothetical protein
MLEPLVILDQSRFTQFGVTNRIATIEIYNGRFVKLIKGNKEEYQVPKHLTNLPEFTSVEKANFVFQNSWL